MSEPPPEAYTGPPSYASPPVYGPPPAAGPSYGEPAYGPPANVPTGRPPADYASAGNPYVPPGYPATTYPPGAYPGAAVDWPPPLPERPTRWRRRGRLTILIVAIGVVLALITGIVIEVVTSNSHGRGRSAASVSIPAGPGVEYRSSKAHFAARFPEPPDERTLPSGRGSPYTVYVAIDTASSTGVETVLFDNGLPESEDETLDEIVTGGSALGLKLSVSATATTFHGHDARQATYDPPTTGGNSVSLLAFVYGRSRVYLLIAPAGRPFENLKTSFVAVP